MKLDQQKRYNKIYSEKFYLCDIAKSKENDNNYDFAISGSTANIYNMTLDQSSLSIKCDCPDATSWAVKKGVICKHCCFLLVRVIKIDEKILENDILTNKDQKFSPQVFWQVKSAVEKMTQSKIYSKDVINLDYIKKYKKIKDNNGQDKNKFSAKKDVDDDDECIICFDTLDPTDKSNLIACPDCNNLLHKFCMEKWLTSGNKTCVYCRSSAWTKYFDVGGSGKYKNLLS